MERGTAAEDAPMLRVEFPLTGRSKELICDLPFAVLSRPGNGQEVPAQKWVAVPNTGGGVALFNDCKYGHSLKDGTLKLTLLRSSYEPDPMGDIGMHLIRWGLTSYKGSWLRAGLAHKGAEFNMPFLTFESRRRKGRWPLAKSFLEISDPQKFMLTAFKPAENGKHLVVRGFDLTGKPGRANLKASARVRKALLTNILEEPLPRAKARVSRSGVSFKTHPHRIMTVVLSK